MAAFTRVNGAAGAMEQVGRELFFKNLSKGSAITQANMEALVAKVQETSTITVIGTFTAGTSTSVNMVIEGADIGNITASDTVAYTVTNVSGF